MTPALWAMNINLASAILSAETHKEKIMKSVMTVTERMMMAVLLFAKLRQAMIASHSILQPRGLMSASVIRISSPRLGLPLGVRWK